MRCSLSRSPFAEGTRAAFALLRIALASPEELRRAEEGARPAAAADAERWCAGAVSEQCERAVTLTLAAAARAAVDAASAELQRAAAAGSSTNTNDAPEEKVGGGGLARWRDELGRRYFASCEGVATFYERLAAEGGGDVAHTALYRAAARHSELIS